VSVAQNYFREYPQTSAVCLSVNLFRRNPEFRQDLLVGNWLITLQPLTGFIERPDLLFADRFAFWKS